MNAINHLIKTEELKFDRIRAAADNKTMFKGDYDATDDTLFVYFGERSTEVVVHYMDEFVGLLYDPDSLEVVGLQIEAFEYSFVPAHGLSATWELNDTDRRELKDVGDMMKASERKMKAMTKEIERITVDPLLRPGRNRSLAFA